MSHMCMSVLAFNSVISNYLSYLVGDSWWASISVRTCLGGQRGSDQQLATSGQGCWTGRGAEETIPNTS